jgi:ribosomal-protein-alanine N-acetyltransferase
MRYYHVRWMIRADMYRVMEIENLCFNHPWREDDFIRHMRQKHTIGMVAVDVDQDNPIGFMIYELHMNRIHLLNFAVHPSFQRRKVGMAMVNKLLSKLEPSRRNRIMLEITETNLAGQLFFKQAGFRAISVLKDFYQNTDLDAYLMQYRVAAPPAVAIQNAMPEMRYRR